MRALRDSIRASTASTSVLSATPVGQVQNYASNVEAVKGIKAFYQTTVCQSLKGKFSQLFKVATQTADVVFEFRVNNEARLYSRFSKEELWMTTLVINNGIGSDKKFIDILKIKLRITGVPVNSVTGVYINEEGALCKNNIESDGDPLYIPQDGGEKKDGSKVNSAPIVNVQIPTPLPEPIPEKLNIVKKEFIGQTVKNDVQVICPLFGFCEVILTDGVLENDLIIEDLEETIQAARSLNKHLVISASPPGIFNYPVRGGYGLMSCKAYGRIEGKMHISVEGSYLFGVEVVIKGGVIKGSVRFKNCNGYIRLENGAKIDESKIINGRVLSEESRQADSGGRKSERQTTATLARINAMAADRVEQRIFELKRDHLEVNPTQQTKDPNQEWKERKLKEIDASLAQYEEALSTHLNDKPDPLPHLTEEENQQRDALLADLREDKIRMIRAEIAKLTQQRAAYTSAEDPAIIIRRESAGLEQQVAALRNKDH